MLKSELIDELNDLLDTLSPKDAYRIFRKLTQDDIIILTLAVSQLRQNRDADGKPRD
jgi:iron uptake system EfeUOB component EfeO/EfeM